MDIKTKLCHIKNNWHDLVAIHKIKTTLTLIKPTCVRICILELSKVPMYESHYDYIKNTSATNQHYYPQILPVNV